MKKYKYKQNLYGWIEVKDDMPIKRHFYRLMDVMFSDGIEQCAWWTGRIWDAGKWRSDNKIIKWKLQ